MSRDHVSIRKAKESFTPFLRFLNLINKSVVSAVWNYGIGQLGIFLAGKLFQQKSTQFYHSNGDHEFRGREFWMK